MLLLRCRGGGRRGRKAPHARDGTSPGLPQRGARTRPRAHLEGKAGKPAHVDTMPRCVPSGRRPSQSKFGARRNPRVITQRCSGQCTMTGCPRWDCCTHVGIVAPECFGRVERLRAVGCVNSSAMQDIDDAEIAIADPDRDAWSSIERMVALHILFTFPQNLKNSADTRATR